MPATPGAYIVKATAVVGDDTWKGRMPINVGVH